MFSCKYSYCKIPCESPGLIIKSYGFGVSFNNGGEGGGGYKQNYQKKKKRFNRNNEIKCALEMN